MWPSKIRCFKIEIEIVNICTKYMFNPEINPLNNVKNNDSKNKKYHKKE